MESLYILNQLKLYMTFGLNKCLKKKSYTDGPFKVSHTRPSHGGFLKSAASLGHWTAVGTTQVPSNITNFASSRAKIALA